MKTCGHDLQRKKHRFSKQTQKKHLTPHLPNHSLKEKTPRRSKKSVAKHENHRGCFKFESQISQLQLAQRPLKLRLTGEGHYINVLSSDWEPNSHETNLLEIAAKPFLRQYGFTSKHD